MVAALEGIRVIDVSQLAAVPIAARILADFGADVVHIEHPVRGDIMRGLHDTLSRSLPGLTSEFPYLWENYNRNKKCITADLSKPEGQQIVYKLVKTADIFLTNLRSYELDAYHMHYKTLCEINPKIYMEVSQVMEDRTERNSPAYDGTAHWARTGLARRMTLPGFPPAGGVGGFGDNSAGMVLYAGVLTALYSREKTGKGQEIDVSLFQTGVYQLTMDISATLATEKRYC